MKLLLMLFPAGYMVISVIFIVSAFARLVCAGIELFKAVMPFPGRSADACSKGGGALENLGSLTNIAFDKMGTLTEGKPKLTDAVAAPGATEGELLSVALRLVPLRHVRWPGGQVFLNAVKLFRSRIAGA